MESFIHHTKGRTPRQLHRDLDGLKDDELGRSGFTGRTANLYRRNDPTQYRAVGDLAGVDRMISDLTPTDETDPAGEPLVMFHNDDCRISLSRRGAAAPFWSRNVDGDELIFVHAGTGYLETEFGRLPYRPGDYLYLPKGVTHRQRPAEPSTLLIIEATDEYRVPEAGVLGRHFPFDPSLVVVPEPEVFTDPAPDGAEEYEIRFRQRVGATSVFYRFHPLDVEGWRGDNFPFAYNIDDYDVITSDSVHLPPTVHLFMQATGVYVMNFLPRPVEGRAGTERLPWYHRNTDYDEIAFFHGGAMFGVDMPPGLISHAPQGIHHGIPERARERARRRFDTDTRVEWKVIAVDTRRRLTPTPAVLGTAPTEVPAEVQV
ncbi:homogentisate 1,2-dioxygenase [Gordonia desulfuricans]|uniref:Homogentisate 1,2-dioxygenase n=1 Tax=Gordonia desulfuricans TaxID=89051 RepID=A0A7K3LPQ2_9ACTN|nr:MULTISPECIES: homogentisate 1,2-dioxygenase [Gordonia]KOY49593.1 dioxygenase [Gordonia sp. NB41Y]NDK90213.1 homogentisate 1,2-dioxygenase [Gordonia desulfuricans]WLP88591.1 homogentisate 1,2-dioxygenase [Gordonia sp. NB41Y]